MQLLRLSPEAELAHRRLSDFVWAQGQWPPATPRPTAALARVSLAAWPKVRRQLATVGWTARAGRLVNREVGQVLAEAQNYLRAKVVSGHSGAEARWRPAPPPAAGSAPAPAPAHPHGSAIAPPWHRHSSAIGQPWHSHSTANGYPMASTR